MSIQLDPIGFVRGGRKDVSDDFWGGCRATIELVPHVPHESLKGLEEFSHAEILFVLDKVAPEEIVLGARHPRGNLAWPKVGIFAQRARARPNRLGATIVRIVGCEGGRLEVEGLDAVDGTPVVDIKPVFSEFLPHGRVRQPEWSREMMRHYWSRGSR